jgi:hypothetical protein
MDRRGQGGIIGALGALVFTLIILDVFFLGWVLIDTPVLEMIQNAV